MVFILTILTNMLITFIFLNLYSRYLAKEQKKIEDRVLVYLQLTTLIDQSGLFRNKRRDEIEGKEVKE